MRIKKSLPIVSAVFLVIAMTTQFFVSYSRNKADIKNRITYKMDLASKDFLLEVYDMPEATAEIVHFLPDCVNDTAGLYAIIENVLWRFPDLFSCYVCYVPNYFPEQGERYAVCAQRISRDSIINYHFEEQLDYFEREWYKGAMESDDNGYWTPSYKDADTDNIIFTHSRKAYDNNGNIIGVACADYTLEWAKQLLTDTRPYDDAVCRIYSSNGTLIVQAGETEDWKDMIVSEKLLPHMNMRLVTAVPRQHLWDGVSRMSLITSLVLLFGILTAGLLIRRLLQDKEEYTRVETANRVMEHELHIASTIQKGILREGEREKVHADKWPDVSLHAALVPMREVGGDLYDFYRKEDDLYFIIGDVSGKSVTAAMFMSATVNLFRSAVRRLQSPKAIVEDMNAVLSENNPSMMFVTAFVGRLHVPTGELLFCNAGHLPPLLVRSQMSKVANQESEVESVKTEPNIPLGYDGKYRFEEQGMMLGQDDMIVLYTDGITEARNEKHEMFGTKRWTALVEKEAEALRKGDMTAINDERLKFKGKAEQTDDMTLLVIAKTSETQPACLSVENKEEQWPVLRTALHNYALCAGMDKRTLKKTELAVEEAVVNIIKHSHAAGITMNMSLQSEALNIQLSDDGKPFDPTKQETTAPEKAVAERRIGGLGIALMRQTADELHYRREEGRNILTITKHIRYYANKD